MASGFPEYKWWLDLLTIFVFQEHRDQLKFNIVTFECSYF